ncbi:hypothetical protein PCCS19_29250 [Paenibacillus sp. CCS19]|nr:hypothetical protein PCCS19_29250 [Paenibacillus cellulosilyticus]
MQPSCRLHNVELCRSHSGAVTVRPCERLRFDWNAVYENLSAHEWPPAAYALDVRPACS